MDDLRAHTRHLQALGELPATLERRAEVAEALHHKHEGIQSVAAQVLCQWGGREAIAAIRAWYLACLDRKRGEAVRGVAIAQLARLVDAKDVDWVLELYFDLASSPRKHEVLPLVLALPPAAARARLLQGLRDSDWINRQAAVKAVGNMAYPDRRQLLTPLIDDPRKEVQKSAWYLAQKA